VLGTDAQTWGRRTPAESRRWPVLAGPDGLRAGRAGWSGSGRSAVWAKLGCGLCGAKVAGRRR
jgi:hypothetical protein